MSIAQYAKVLLLSPITGGAVVCGLAAVAFGVALATSHPHEAKANAPAISPAGVAPVATPLPAPAVVEVRTGGSVSRRPSAPVRALSQPLFHGTLAPEDRTALRALVGMTAQDAVRTMQLRAIVERVVPYAQFHYGVDVPLPEVLKSILARSAEPVHLRQDRYLLLANSGAGPSRSFLWVDLKEGTAVGGIFFHPANGEPTPTLTLFSSQVTRDSTTVRALPAALLTDMRTWTSTAGVPPVETRYFVNAAGRKSVLLHGENLCGSDAPAPPPGSSCESLKAIAASTDAAATAFLAQTHYASNATVRMMASTHGE